MRRFLSRFNRRPDGFTLIEVIVVIGVVSVMFSIVLSGLQSAREAARRTSCMNHFAQLAKGMIQHESQHRFFPTGGWSEDWLGNGDRATDSSQPGGWTFTVLPFIEETALKDSVTGLSSVNAEQKYQEFCETPVEVFVCPSRRPAAAITTGNKNRFLTGASSATIEIKKATRCDYAANGGGVGACLHDLTDAMIDKYETALLQSNALGGPRQVTFQCWQTGACKTRTTNLNGFLNGHRKNHKGSKTGERDRLGPCPDDLESLGCQTIMDVVTYSPTSLSDGDMFRKKTIADRIANPDPTSDSGIPDLQNGLIARMSQVRAGTVLDGLSNVYLLGEKYVSADQYETGDDSGDQSILYAGYSTSNVRWATYPPTPDEAGQQRPSAFGSAHPGTWNAAFGDGSVRSMSYEIDPEVHKNLAAKAPRFEGEVLPAF